MRIIITGATGFVGRALSKHMVERGHEVIALTRNLTKAQDLLVEQVKSVKWDGRSAQGWVALADGAGAIVNLAGENISGRRWTQATKRAILQSRLIVGRAVVEAVERSAVKSKVIVQASGIGYYGPHGEEMLEESSPSKNRSIMF